MVTAGTYRKVPYLNSPERLDLAMRMLFDCAVEFGWQLQAWAILSNHYHFIAFSPNDSSSLRRFIGKMHMVLAKEINSQDSTLGRKVWHQYWDSRITYERSYFVRLNYVHNNPMHHRLVPVATAYRWCSAAWFERNAPIAFVKTVQSFKYDKLSIPDDF